VVTEYLHFSIQNRIGQIEAKRLELEKGYRIDEWDFQEQT
jgi:hypothetical protein